MRALFEKFNPFRSPAWRFERVLEMVSRRPTPARASRTDDDKWIRGYRKFLTRIEGRETRDAQMEVCQENPALYYAHLIHHNPDKDYRLRVQARVLAGETDYEIARKQWGTLPAAITWYRHLFFDIADRMQHKDYIDKVIAGRWDDRQSNPDGSITFYQDGMMLRLFAFYGGPIMLDFVIRHMNGLGRAWKDAECAGWQDKGWARSMRNNSSKLMHTFPFNKWTVMQLFEIHLKLIEMEQAAQLAGGGAPTDYKRNVEELLKQVPWSIGDRGFKDKTQLELEYDETAAEPRANETLLLARGSAPMSLQEVKELELRLAAEK